MKLNRNDLYQYIGWIIALLTTPVVFTQSWFLGILFIIIIAILIALNFFLLKNNHRLKDSISNYEILFSNEIPLYGLINYIIKNKSTNHENKCRIEEVILIVKVVGDISPKRRNDLRYEWSFYGQNLNKEPLRQMWFRFGGENSADFSELQYSSYDCTTNNEGCKLDKNDILFCENEEVCLNNKANYRIKVDENTYKLVEVEFNKPIIQFEIFKMKYKYTWPQCYNTTCDYLILDTKNFSDNVKEFIIKVFVDDKIITKNASLHMFSVNRNTFENLPEEKFEFSKNENCFIKKINAEKSKIYYASIVNNVE